MVTQNQLLYGASNLVSKHECVGHVQKRMGKALREKAKEKFVNERGGRLKERLTDKTIKLLTRYYGKAIRSNTGDCTAMQDAVWAVFYHSQSTDSNPQYQYCPSGQRSWCKFNRALTNSEPSPPHSPTIHPDNVPPLSKVFERLSPYTNGALRTWSNSESERVIQ